MKSHSNSGRQGWSLVLLLLVMTAFIAAFPVISSYVQTKSYVTTAFERWSQWQHAKEGSLILASQGTPGTFIYDVPGGSLEISTTITQSPDETVNIPFEDGQSGSVPPNSTFVVYNSNGTVFGSYDMSDGGSYEVGPPESGHGNVLYLRLRDSTEAIIVDENLGNPNNNRSLSLSTAGSTSVGSNVSVSGGSSGFSDSPWSL